MKTPGSVMATAITPANCTAKSLRRPKLCASIGFAGRKTPPSAGFSSLGVWRIHRMAMEPRLTAYPASHILGAAQLLIELGGSRVVYTGDIKLREPICGTKTKTVQCDRLIIESTFGLPIYRFLSAEDARYRIVAFARECLRDGITPVFMGYPLGRGQEAAHVLCHAGIPTAIHGAIARLMPVYEDSGFTFPGWFPYNAKETEGKALVVVPGFRAYLEASGKNTRLAYVSGWAAIDNARNRSGAEELIPYSDHADFQELLALVEASGASEVDVVHGYTEAFARILSRRGITATAPHAAAARSDSRGDGRLMDQLARTCEEIARWNSRLRKVRTLAEYLRQLSEGDLNRAVRFLCCGPIQSTIESSR